MTFNLSPTYLPENDTASYSDSRYKPGLNSEQSKSTDGCRTDRQSATTATRNFTYFLLL